MKLIRIALRGADFVNKGAEAMLKATQEELSQRISCEFFISKHGPHSKNKADFILDLSGFTYSSHTSWGKVETESALNVRKNHPSTPWIFLPQTFGPFYGIEEKCSQLFKGQKIFARDFTSQNHLSRLPSNFDFMIGPDLTWNAQADYYKGASLLKELCIDQNKSIIGISPNMRAYSRIPHYTDLLKKIITDLSSEAQFIAIPHEIRTDGKHDDRFLCNQLGIPSLLSEYSSEELKGVIGHLDMLIGSRYHALLAALSMNIPVVSFGWSHKYSELLDEFDVSYDQTENVMPDIQSIRNTWHNRTSISQRITPLVSCKKLETKSFFNFLAEYLDNQFTQRWSLISPSVKAGASCEDQIKYFTYRRNVHRLEKGLSFAIIDHNPRAFGEDYIRDIIQYLTSSPYIDNDSMEWGANALSSYFQLFPDSALKIQFSAIDNSIRATPTVTKTLASVEARPQITLDAFTMLCRSRRSIRHFSNKTVDFSIIQKCFEAAQWAPSACNRQSFKLLYYTGVTAKKISEIPYGARGIFLPALVVVVASYAGYSNPQDIKCPIIDSSLSSMSFMLALASAGLSSLPINFPESNTLNQQAKEICGLAKHEIVVMLIGVGYADPKGLTPSSMRRPVKDILINKCDQQDASKTSV